MGVCVYVCNPCLLNYKSLLVSQELLLIFQPAVLSLKQMADQQLGMTAEDPLRSECLSVGYDDITGREKVEHSSYLLQRLENRLPGLFVKQWVPRTDETINQIKKKSITKRKGMEMKINVAIMTHSRTCHVQPLWRGHHSSVTRLPSSVFFGVDESFRGKERLIHPHLTAHYGIG